ncbi:MAG TPA: serine/threonine-protein kinase [Rudaea sp.]|jgi:serine/threonine-protein kinase|nr:serine/threonine-protein kinase [Rudaea sp.]
MSASDTQWPPHSSDSLQRLRTLFSEAVEVEPSARSSWLDSHVPDTGERAALENLLTADGSDGYFETPADQHAERMKRPEFVVAEGWIGDRIGAFRLVRLLGKGGMAVVFLGERDDGDFAQQVAVKLLRRGLLSELEQRLFRRERQLLARLDHPNIARLVDGGVTASGIPYLALEYVDGQAITDFCRHRNLGVSERLHLFLIVCRAVAAAHRSLVVHRDIKPSNILVTGLGVVKLLDFGIAKLLDEDVEQPTVGIFTPDYAAPEQLTAGTITTATDVYSLGVLLYELLTERRPDRTSPRRPSVLLAADGSKNAKILRGDLDTIVLKCITDEPERRYASAAELADDIERYLSRRVVVAHPPSRRYRLRKFLRRHRGGVAISSAFALVVFAALGVALWEARAAGHEAERAEHVRGFVEDMFSPIGSSVIEAKQLRVYDLLANATKKMSESRDLEADERIDLQLMFSQLHEKMGDSDQAQTLAQDAAQLADSTLPANDALRLQAHLAYAVELLAHDDVTAAEPMLLALHDRASLLHGLPAAQLDDGLGEIADLHGDHRAAVDYERSALAERIAASGADSAAAATGYNNFAISLDLSGAHAEAIDAFRKAYAIHLATEGPDSFETAIAQDNLAVAEMQEGLLRAARNDFLAVERLFDAAPNNTRNRNVRYWQERCQLATIIGQDEEAVCERALRVTTTILRPDDVAWIARALRWHAQMKFDLGDLDAAQSDLERANLQLAASDDAVALGLNDYVLGEIDIVRGDLDGAKEKLARSVERIGSASPDYLRVRALAALALACSNTSSDARCTAAASARESLDAQQNPWNPWLLPAHVAIARLDLSAGNREAANQRLQQAIAAASQEMEPTQIDLLAARVWFAAAQANGNFLRRDVLATVIAAHAERHPLVAAPPAASHRGACGASPGK